ncbi:hypothetical protein [Aliivibrio wodanis]|uniref:hypothetical protein n=1 Tax=Aliivibrio wodanis TaxID=80852 RepID=UPI00406C633D
MRNKYAKSKQQGAMSLEAVMIISGVVVALLFVMSKAPTIMYKMNTMMFMSQAAEIAQATQGRPSPASLTIPKLCERSALSEKICGEAKNGLGTNPFGGDWVLRGNASSVALVDLTATLPNDSDRVLDLADLMAPSTRAGCESADSCSTIKTSATSITMTY